MTNIILGLLRYIIGAISRASAILYDKTHFIGYFTNATSEALDTIIEWLQMVNFIVPLSDIWMICFLHFQLSLILLGLWIVNKVINLTADIL